MSVPVTSGLLEKLKAVAGSGGVAGELFLSKFLMGVVVIDVVGFCVVAMFCLVLVCVFVFGGLVSCRFLLRLVCWRS